MRKSELTKKLLRAISIIKEDYMSFDHTEEEANDYVYSLLEIDEEDLFDLLKK